ncbi:MAG TPA: hypothetical protein VFX76_11670 [Roseiflexaceae bacterium]|nr:hypothetical protein [Roseiflexaceae bacterium]
MSVSDGAVHILRHVALTDVPALRNLLDYHDISATTPAVAGS